MTVALRARGVGKRFETVQALDGVDLDVAEGEVRGLLGPNGAGKTTLLRALFGLVRTDGGTIELFDRRLDPEYPDALDGVSGFVEEPAFYPYLSGRVNLELLAELDGPDAAARVPGALEQVGLAARADDRVGGYSTGMRQRLGIAACLVRAPRLLLLDEPTSGLDPSGLREMHALVERLARDGVAILISSHLIGELAGLCHSYTILRRGQVVWDGTADQLAAQAPPSAYRLLTSDDARALTLAAQHASVHADSEPEGGLRVVLPDTAIDGFVLALARAGVAVRRLELVTSPLEAMFFALTDDAPAAQSPATAPASSQVSVP